MIVKVYSEEKELPIYATEGSLGLDLIAVSFKKLITRYNINVHESHFQGNKLRISSGDRVLVGTGLKVEIPKGYVLDIRTRSGLALKSGLVVANSPGTIDADYRGEIGVILTNLSADFVEIEKGERIAQAVLVKAEQIEWVKVPDEVYLTKTERGEGGFGSTGK